MPFTIIQQDITKMQVDAIVNAANTELRRGGGVCGAIFAAAGIEELEAACQKLAPIHTSQAVATRGFHLPVKWIIHAAGPIYANYLREEAERLLYATYQNSLSLAKDLDCKSIAFPLISSGIYGYPKQEALRIAREAITDYLIDDEMEIYLAIFD